MWLSSCGCSLSAENTERWVQWERDQWAAEGEVKPVKDEWRWSDDQPSWAENHECVCVRCMQGKWELVFSYADELLLLFAVCLFRGIYAPGLKIKALMARSSRSGSRVGGLLLSQHVAFMKERQFSQFMAMRLELYEGNGRVCEANVSMTHAIRLLERQGWRSVDHIDTCTLNLSHEAFLRFPVNRKSRISPSRQLSMNVCKWCCSGGQPVRRLKKIIIKTHTTWIQVCLSGVCDVLLRVFRVFAEVGAWLGAREPAFVWLTALAFSSRGQSIKCCDYSDGTQV